MQMLHAAAERAIFSDASAPLVCVGTELLTCVTDSDGHRHRYSLQDDPHFSPKANKTLSCWLFKHINKPHPTQDECRALASKAGVTWLQVMKWLTSARKRIQSENSCAETARPSQQSHHTEKAGASTGTGSNTDVPLETPLRATLTQFQKDQLTKTIDYVVKHSTDLTMTIGRRSTEKSKRIKLKQRPGRPSLGTFDVNSSNGTGPTSNNGTGNHSTNQQLAMGQMIDVEQATNSKDQNAVEQQTVSRNTPDKAPDTCIVVEQDLQSAAPIFTRQVSISNTYQLNFSSNCPNTLPPRQGTSWSDNVPNTYYPVENVNQTPPIGSQQQQPSQQQQQYFNQSQLPHPTQRFPSGVCTMPNCQDVQLMAPPQYTDVHPRHQMQPTPQQTGLLREMLVRNMPGEQYLPPQRAPFPMVYRPPPILMDPFQMGGHGRGGPVRTQHAANMIQQFGRHDGPQHWMLNGQQQNNQQQGPPPNQNAAPFHQASPQVHQNFGRLDGPQHWMMYGQQQNNQQQGPPPNQNAAPFHQASPQVHQNFGRLDGPQHWMMYGQQQNNQQQGPPPNQNAAPFHQASPQVHQNFGRLDGPQHWMMYGQQQNNQQQGPPPNQNAAAFHQAPPQAHQNFVPPHAMMNAWRQQLVNSALSQHLQSNSANSAHQQPNSNISRLPEGIRGPAAVNANTPTIIEMPDTPPYQLASDAPQQRPKIVNEIVSSTESSPALTTGTRKRKQSCPMKATKSATEAEYDEDDLRFLQTNAKRRRTDKLYHCEFCQLRFTHSTTLNMHVVFGNCQPLGRVKSIIILDDDTSDKPPVPPKSTEGAAEIRLTSQPTVPEGVNDDLSAAQPPEETLPVHTSSILDDLNYDQLSATKELEEVLPVDVDLTLPNTNVALGTATAGCDDPMEMVSNDQNEEYAKIDVERLSEQPEEQIEHEDGAVDLNYATEHLLPAEELNSAEDPSINDEFVESLMDGTDVVRQAVPNTLLDQDCDERRTILIHSPPRKRITRIWRIKPRCVEEPPVSPKSTEGAAEIRLTSQPTVPEGVNDDVSAAQPPEEALPVRTRSILDDLNYDQLSATKELEKVLPVDVDLTLPVTLGTATVGCDDPMEMVSNDQNKEYTKIDVERLSEQPEKQIEHEYGAVDLNSATEHLLPEEELNSSLPAEEPSINDEFVESLMDGTGVVRQAVLNASLDQDCDERRTILIHSPPRKRITRIWRIKPTIKKKIRPNVGRRSEKSERSTLEGISDDIDKILALLNSELDQDDFLMTIDNLEAALQTVTTTPLQDSDRGSSASPELGAPCSQQMTEMTDDTKFKVPFVNPIWAIEGVDYVPVSFTIDIVSASAKFCLENYEIVSLC